MPEFVMAEDVRAERDEARRLCREAATALNRCRDLLANRDVVTAAEYRRLGDLVRRLRAVGERARLPS